MILPHTLLLHTHYCAGPWRAALVHPKRRKAKESRHKRSQCTDSGCVIHSHRERMRERGERGRGGGTEGKGVHERLCTPAHKCVGGWMFVISSSCPWSMGGEWLSLTCDHVARDAAAHLTLRTPLIDLVVLVCPTRPSHTKSQAKRRPGLPAAAAVAAVLAVDPRPEVWCCACTVGRGKSSLEGGEEGV